MFMKINHLKKNQASCIVMQLFILLCIDEADSGV